MIPGTVYIHDRHQLAVFHERSGYVALAPRDLVLCARAEEIRIGFTTSFFPRTDNYLRINCYRMAGLGLRRGAFEPRGEARADPCAEEIAWRDAVLATLDALVRMSDQDRHFADLQAMWRGAAQETL